MSTSCEMKAVQLYSRQKRKGTRILISPISLAKTAKWLWHPRAPSSTGATLVESNLVRANKAAPSSELCTFTATYLNPAFPFLELGL